MREIPTDALALVEGPRTDLVPTSAERKCYSLATQGQRKSISFDAPP